MRLRLALAVGLATALVAGRLVQAADRHWPRGATILTWIDPKYMPAGADDLVARAMRTWTTAADGRFTMQRTSSERAAGIRVHFYQLTTKFGQTAPSVDPRTGAITDAEVDITVSETGSAVERAIVIYLTALHELGHALGLPHRDEFSSIMYSFRYPGDSERFFGRYRALLSTPEDIGSPMATGLSSADLMVLRTLYDR